MIELPTVAPIRNQIDCVRSYAALRVVLIIQNPSLIWRGFEGLGLAGRLARSVLVGWGGRIRTYACMDQNHVPYRLATPQYELRDRLYRIQPEQSIIIRLSLYTP